jgi:hypothetical protein
MVTDTPPMRAFRKKLDHSRSKIMVVTSLLLFVRRRLKMEMRWWLWTSLLAFGLTVGRVFAQDAVRPAPSASDVRVVCVRVVHTVGMCGGYGHCTAITTISPSFIIRESKDSGEWSLAPITAGVKVSPRPFAAVRFTVQKYRAG